MKSRFKLFIVQLLIGTAFLHGQNPGSQQKIEAEINETVWQPFKKSYEERDWQTFNSLHSDDVLRVYDGGIRVGSEYKNSNKESYQKKKPAKVTIDFVMERRTYREDVGYEVGFYRVVYKEEGKEDRTSFGRFHVVLKKIDGSWKITQDWDSNSFNGRPIGADDFDEKQMLNLTN